MWANRQTPQKDPKSSKDNPEDEKPVRKPTIVRNTTDLQRLRVEKLMKNPSKPIIIPERPKEKGVPVVPDFVRNVMGSSAGAGSGEFHVYRHLRRKEYARQRYMKEKGVKEQLDEDYHQKLEENQKLAEERTAKKRKKRLKKKGKKGSKKAKGSETKKGDDNSSSESEDDEITKESEDDETKKSEDDETTREG